MHRIATGLILSIVNAQKRAGRATTRAYSATLLEALLVADVSRVCERLA